MRRFSILLALASIPAIMSAQLVVNSSGDVFISQEDNDSYAKLTVNDGPIESSVIDIEYPIIGTRSQSVTSTNNKTVIGVLGEGKLNASNGSSVGVWGESYGAPEKNFGVVGMLDMYNHGAGIYATTESNLNFFTSGGYAGYFVGPTYFDGYVTVTGSLFNLSDKRLKENVTSLKDLNNDKSPLEKLKDIDVVEYDLKLPDNLRQTPKERHFGIYAQELQELYPNLVKKGQDGYLTVNYIEMIPLLLRSIQELKQELDEVKGISNAMTRSVGDETAGFSTVPTGNKLFQNTPNPFKEQTIIRFSLEENVHDASICIFDMTGKTLKKLPISSGMESVSVGGYELGEGMFLYSLIVNGQVIDTKRMVISK